MFGLKVARPDREGLFQIILGDVQMICVSLGDAILKPEQEVIFIAFSDVTVQREDSVSISAEGCFETVRVDDATIGKICGGPTSDLGGHNVW